MLDIKVLQINKLLVMSFLFVLVINQCAASNQQWANSGGLWGKRSAAPLNEPVAKAANYMPPQSNNMYNWMVKRTAQWQAAQGLWGKRSDPQAPYYSPLELQYPQQA